MSANRIRIFGELFENPAPLEWSLNNCNRNCKYCFSRLNGRNVHNEDCRGTLSFVKKVFSERYNEHSFAEYLLRHKYPVVISNAVDPLVSSNLEATKQLLGMLKKCGVPVILQTRGTAKASGMREIIPLLKPSDVLYMSVTTFDETIRKDAEPGSPSNEDRLAMMQMAAEAGISRTIAAINPAVPAWIGDPQEFIEKCRKYSGDTIKGTWIEALHLKEQQHKALLEEGDGKLSPALDDDVAQSAVEGRREEWFFDELFEACDDVGWKRFSASDKGNVDSLFDLYSSRFPSTLSVIRECKRIYEHDRKQVVVSFRAWASWVGIPDISMTRSDGWEIINSRQTAGQENRAALPRLVTLRQVANILWNNPRFRHLGFWNTFKNFKLLVERSDRDKNPSHNPDDADWKFTRQTETGDIIGIYSPDTSTPGIATEEDLEQYDLIGLPLKPQPQQENDNA